MQKQGNRGEIRDRATLLILILWRAIDWEKVSPGRRMGIYDEFEGKLKAAASTNTIESFIERIKAKMGIKTGQCEPELLDIIAEGGEQILDCIRTETATLVLRLRKVQQEKKEEYYQKCVSELREQNYTPEEIEVKMADIRGKAEKNFPEVDAELIKKLFGKGENDEKN